MTFIGEKNFGLEVALGNVPGYQEISRTGVAPDCDSGVATDIWDGADGVTATKIWVPPTVARIHDIVSTDADDAAAGIGLRTLLVAGVGDWTLPRISEVIVLNGLTPVPTVNSYAVIDSLVGISWGSTETNDGIITATAQVDGTVTAAILVGRGRTRMAILAVPQGFTWAISRYSCSLLTTSGGGAGADALIELLIRLNTFGTDGGFIAEGGVVITTGAPHAEGVDPPLAIPGPRYVKAQATSDTNNTAVSVGLRGYFVEDALS